MTNPTPTRRPLRPCRHPGCAARTTDGGCDRHPITKHHWKPDRERGNRHERGYDAAWQHSRALVLGRDHYLCQTCRRQSANEVDHVIPKSRGGTDELDNLKAICAPCHAAKTARESRRSA